MPFFHLKRAISAAMPSPMIDPGKLAAFALVTGLTSMIPGPSMLFVLSQSVWRGTRSGVAALAGLQLGYVLWWLLAGLGLGTLAAAFPIAFRFLAIGGAAYLGWLGVQALRQTRHADAPAELERGKPGAKALRDGVLVAIGNPKSLIYIVALLPPFVDGTQPVAAQLAILALVAMTIDLAIGSLYILAGGRLTNAMAQPAARRRLNIAVGCIFIAIGAAILIQLFRGG